MSESDSYVVCGIGWEPGQHGFVMEDVEARNPEDALLAALDQAGLDPNDVPAVVELWVFRQANGERFRKRFARDTEPGAS